MDGRMQEGTEGTIGNKTQTVKMFLLIRAIAHLEEQWELTGQGMGRKRRDRSTRVALSKYGAYLYENVLM